MSTNKQSLVLSSCDSSYTGGLGGKTMVQAGLGKKFETLSENKKG
jgi:hypothetical protein